jgi:hypothetical protein
VSPFHVLRVRKSRLLVVALAVIAFGIAIVVNALEHSSTRRVPATAFAIKGTFAYDASTTSDPLVYPNGVATTGEELVLNDVRQLTVHFSAGFASKLPERLHGTVSLQEVFLGDSGWRNVYKVGEPVPLTGTTPIATETITLSRLEATPARLQAGSATAARSYPLRLQAVVRYAGTVGPWRVASSDSPKLPFTMDAAVLAPQALGLPGEASQRALEQELHPTQTVQLQRSIPNVISFLGVPATADEFRIAGCVLVLLGLVLVRNGARGRRRRADPLRPRGWDLCGRQPAAALRLSQAGRERRPPGDRSCRAPRAVRRAGLVALATCRPAGAVTIPP